MSGAVRAVVSSLWIDIRFALRMMWKTPGMTAVLVVTLAVGIGASTAIFSVVNSVVLRPLAFEAPERLWVRATTVLLQAGLDASLRGIFYGARMTEPGVLAIVAVAIAVMALLATWIPVRRVTRVMPSEVLKNE